MCLVRKWPLKLFDRQRAVRIDANRCRYVHRMLGNRASVEISVARERFRRSERVRPAGSDTDDPFVGLNQIAVARQQEYRRLVQYDEHRLEASQRAVGPPVFGQLDRRTLEVPSILFQFGFETREERK